MILDLPTTIIPIFIFLHLAISGSVDIDTIAVNCGSSGSSTSLDGRHWVGDAGSRTPSTFSTESKGRLISSSSSIDRTSLDNSFDPIPYKTARISRSEFSYTFRLSLGPKLIRLHFHPSSYSGFKKSNSIFTVKAGNFTLLRNFSAARTADDLAVKVFWKEFCINVEENKPFIITFTPSTDKMVAFINGIEVVSLPSGLYHSETSSTTTAMETVHRLNIGGAFISPAQDAGMFREWLSDSDYLLEPNSVIPLLTNARIRFSKVPDFVAPQKIYQRSWLMNSIHYRHEKADTCFTWKLPVDVAFRYLVRLHFCELDYNTKEVGDKTFKILMNNETVEANGDLIKWGGDIGVAFYRDYIVKIQTPRGLLISICPYGNQRNEMLDAVLKGLEVLKLSDPDHNLAGETIIVVSPSMDFGFLIKWYFHRIVGTVLVITILTGILFNKLAFWRGRVLIDRRSISYSPNRTIEETCKVFSLAEIRKATNNFSKNAVIGHDISGKIYKGCMGIDKTIVTIKRFWGEKEFMTEILILSNLRHKHVIKLIGYCRDRNEMILVYEHMAKGSLADHIHKSRELETDGTPLRWEQRLNICLNAARGLDYLHTGTQHNIIHRDVKSSSILLDENYVVKIADFGICKMSATANDRFTGVFTDVKGTIGYLDPEYFITHWLTKKSDVYAFGVVLWEVLCGRPAVDTKIKEQRNLVLWAQRSFKEKKVEDIVDPTLKFQISPACLKMVSTVANICLHSVPDERPSMADVVASLERATDLQRSGEDVSDDEIKRLTNATTGNVSSPNLKLSQNAVTALDHASFVSDDEIEHSANSTTGNVSSPNLKLSQDAVTALDHASFVSDDEIERSANATTGNVSSPNLKLSQDAVTALDQASFVSDDEIERSANATTGNVSSPNLKLSQDAVTVLCQYLKLDEGGPYTLDELCYHLKAYKAFENFLPDKRISERFGHRVRESLHEFQKYTETGKVHLENKDDDGIHPLAKVVMDYMKNISHYKETINALLSVNEDPNPTNCHFNSIVSSLELVIRGVSSGKEESHGRVFLMNNINYLIQEAKESHELVAVLGDDWVRTHKRLVENHKFEYERITLCKVCPFLRIDQGSSNRNLLKESLKSFNLAFEDIYKTQTAWYIPDHEIRQELRLVVSSKQIQAYRPFVDKCERNGLNKYIKYSAEDLENYFDDLFEGLPKHLNNRNRRS